jgi:surface polysaccharide O-acyltransferase-like enzyme
MPRGYGLSFFIFAAMAAPFARIRILAAVGATLLSIYFVGLWIEDFSGTIKRFAYGRNSELFVAAICAHLSITATILLYFLWRLFFKRSIPGKTPDAL